MGYGDEILAAGQAQKLYEADPCRRVAICDRANRPRWSDIWDGNPIIARPAAVGQGAAVQRLISGPGCRPYIVYPFTPQTGWTFNRSFRARDHVAKIYLALAEQSLGVRLRQAYGPYVLIDPWSKHENLRWPLDAWRGLVASRPDLTWIQHTYAGVPPMAVIPGALPCVTSTFRAACGVVASAALYVRGESGMCHAAAALGIPQVTIWGACMDWDVLGGYAQQYGLVSEGRPCGRYLPCRHCQQTMAQIDVATVSAAITAQLQQYGLR